MPGPANTIKAVIFDMGGVLVRTEDRQPRTRLAESYGMTYAQAEELVFASETAHAAEAGKISAKQHWQAIATHLGINEDQVMQFRADFFAGDHWDQDLLALIRSFRPRYQTALLSNAWSSLREELVAEGGIIESFDRVFISSEIKMVKPNPEIFQYVLHEMDIRPHEAVFVDDFQRNIEGARAVGLHAIRFTGIEKARRDLMDLLSSPSNWR